MKLYYFNSNNYGSQYIVMAEDEKQAHSFLIEHLRRKSDLDGYYKGALEFWLNIDPLDKSTLPYGRTIDVYKEGEVIEFEIS